MVKLVIPSKFLKYILSEIKNYPRIACGLFLVSIILPFLDILSPWILSNILGEIVGSRDGDLADGLMLLLAFFLGANILRAIATAIQLKLGFSLDAKILEVLREKLFKRIFELKRSTNSVALSSITLHFQSISKFWGSMIWETLTSLLFMVSASIVLFVIDWRLAVAASIPIPLVLAAVMFLGPRFRRSMNQYFSRMDQVSNELVEAGENRDFILASALNAKVTRIFKEHSKIMSCDARSFGFWTAIYAPVFDLVAAVSTALLIVFFLYVSDQAATELETFLTFFVFLSYFYRPIYAASGLVESWQKTVSAYDALEDLGFDVDDISVKNIEIRDANSTANVKLLESSVGHHQMRIEKLSFGYDKQPPILVDADAIFPAHKRVAIIGENGLGKSTVLKLLVGVILPKSGRVLYGSSDRLFAYLPQSVFLHSGSIIENLMLVHKGFDLGLDVIARDQVIADIIDVGRRAGILDKLSKLDLNIRDYESPVKRLSGGQKQLIGLWRFAIQAETADYLFMDEPDAYLDIEGLNKVLPKVLEMYRNKTTVIVSHNASILRDSDVLFKLENRLLIATT